VGDRGIIKAGDLEGITKAEDSEGTEAKNYSVKKAGNGGEHH